MISLLQKISSVLVMTEFVLGNFANSFIALVNCSDWVKRQKLSCADRILTALAVSRISLLWLIVLSWYAIMFNPAFWIKEVRIIVYTVWIVSQHFCLWLATSLSILYFLKIANFSCLLFLHLKRKAERVVIIILLGNLFILISHLSVLSIETKMQLNEYEGNITWESSMRDILYLASMTIFTLANIIPFAMSLTALLLLIFSLWKHLKKMKLSGKGSQDPSTKVHVRALQTVTSFLLLFVLSFLAQIMSTWSSKTLQNDLILMLCEVLRILHPSTHSLILIWENKKLRLAFLSFLWQLRCWLNERK